MTQTTVEFDVFNVAAAPPAKAKGAKEKQVLPYGGPLNEFNEARDRVKALEGIITLTEGQIKAAGAEHFIRLYRRDKKRPESFVMEGTDGGRIMYLPIDKYGTVTPEKAQEAPPGCIAEEVTFEFNAAMLQKHRQAISRAIANADDIPVEDKPLLLQKRVKQTVQKGLIDRLHTLPDIAAAWYWAAPVVQLKNVGGL